MDIGAEPEHEFLVCEGAGTDDALEVVRDEPDVADKPDVADELIVTDEPDVVDELLDVATGTNDEALGSRLKTSVPGPHLQSPPQQNFESVLFQSLTLQGRPMGDTGETSSCSNMFLQLAFAICTRQPFLKPLTTQASFWTSIR